jgi:phosphomevalonate kinase
VIVEATAPGKLVVSGEYAVLSGAPALVLAVERRMRVSMRPGGRDWSIGSVGFAGASRHALAALAGGPDLARDDPATAVQHVLRAAIARGHVLDALPRDLEVVIDSSAGVEAGAKLGIGTSAAVCAALAAACLSLAGHGATDTLEVALAAHRDLQGGRGSGLDVAAAFHGGLIRFERPPVGASARSRSPAIRERALAPTVARLGWPAGIAWLPIVTGVPASTSDFIGRFERYCAGAVPDPLAHLVAVARAVVAALPDADGFMRELRAYTARLDALDQAAGLGIFGPHHARLRALAPADVVYKPCGAGGGDLGIACAGDAAALEAFGAAAAAAGYTPLRMEIARHGVDVSITR